MQQDQRYKSAKKMEKNPQKKTKKKPPQLVPEVVWFSSPPKKTLPEIADKKKNPNAQFSGLFLFLITTY